MSRDTQMLINTNLKNYLIRFYKRFINNIYKLISIFILKFHKVNSFQRNKGNIYICINHAAGDFLMASTAAKTIIDNFEINKIHLICIRNEVKLLVKYWFQDYKDINIISVENLPKFSNEDLIVGLCGPNPLIMKNFIFKKFKFIGFLFDLNIRSNIKGIASKIEIKKNINHIRRNNLIIEYLCKLEVNSIKDKIFKPERFFYKKVNYNNSNKFDITFFLPQEKSYKAYPPKLARKLILELSKDFKCNIIYFEKDKITRAQFSKQALLFNKINLNTYHNWSELANLLFNSKLVICTDSVVYHLCNALDIKTISLFGHTSFNNYKTFDSSIIHIDYSNPNQPCYFGCGSNKYGRNNECNPFCHYLEKIKTEDVLEKVYDLKIK